MTPRERRGRVLAELFGGVPALAYTAEAGWHVTLLDVDPDELADDGERADELAEALHHRRVAEHLLAEASARRLARLADDDPARSRLAELDEALAGFRMRPRPRLRVVSDERQAG